MSTNSWEEAQFGSLWSHLYTQEIEQVDWVPGPVAQAPLGPLRKEKIMLGLLFNGEFTIEIVVLIIKTMGYNWKIGTEHI